MVKAGQFERAFVAVSYALGVRGEALAAPLGKARNRAHALLAKLSDNERSLRAQALAAELHALMLEVEELRLK